MQLDDLLALLPSAESIDLDYKRTFPPHYFEPGHQRYHDARATLIKDVAAMANATSPNVGHLVYGIADQNGRRSVHPVRRTASEDSARLGQVLARHLDPVPSFEYAEFEYQEQLVGLLRIHRTMPYPHVVREALGTTIVPGQVWIRRGTGTEIALHADLTAIFQGETPFTVSSHPPDERVAKLTAALKAEGFESSWVPETEVEVRTLAGYEVLYLPGTRRRIRSAMDFKHTQWQFLMKRWK